MPPSIPDQPTSIPDQRASIPDQPGSGLDQPGSGLIEPGPSLLLAGAPFRRRAALADGLTPTQLRELADQGLLRRLHREVFVDARVPDSVNLRARALSLVLPDGAAVARQTAAWLFGVDARAPGEHLELPDIVCAVPAGSANPLRRPDISCHQADLGADVVLVAGVPCTSPLRTTVDLLRFTPPFIGLASADAFARKGLVAPEEVAAEVERWRGRRYVDRARRLADLIEPATESPGESWLRLRIVDAGFPARKPRSGSPGSARGPTASISAIGKPARASSTTARSSMPKARSGPATNNAEPSWSVSTAGPSSASGGVKCSARHSPSNTPSVSSSAWSHRSGAGTGDETTIARGRGREK
jgi:hypothetical protein